MRYLEALTPQNTTLFFNELACQYGVLSTAIYIMESFFYNMIKVSDIFSAYKGSSLTSRISHLGILIFDSTGSKILEKSDICSNLIKNGIKVSIFSPEPERSGSYLSICKLRNVSRHGNDPEAAKRHLRSLYHAVKNSDINAVLFLDASRPFLLWDTILLKLMGVCVIGNYEYKFIKEIHKRGRNFKHREMISMLRCLDAFICKDKLTTVCLH